MVLPFLTLPYEVVQVLVELGGRGGRKNHLQPLPSEQFHPDMYQTTAEQPKKKKATGDQPRGKAKFPHHGLGQ